MSWRIDTPLRRRRLPTLLLLLLLLLLLSVSVLGQPPPTAPINAFASGCIDSSATQQNQQACMVGMQNCISGGNSACTDGNGVCYNAACVQCGQAAPGLLYTLPSQVVTNYDSRCQPTSSPAILYQVQPFVIGSPGFRQGPGAFQLIHKQALPLSTSYPLSEHNTFLDGFAWSRNVGGSDAVIAKTSLYFGVRIVAFEDSSVSMREADPASVASGRACVYGECVCISAMDGCVPLNTPPSLTVAVGLVLSTSPTPRAIAGTTSQLRYTTDPLTFFDMLSAGFTTVAKPVVNFSLAAETLRVMRVDTSIVPWLNLSSSVLSGRLVAWARPRLPARVPAMLYPYVAQTGAMPILLKDALRLMANQSSAGSVANFTAGTTPWILQNLSSTLGHGGGFSRSFGFTVGPSKRATMVLLDRGWNVFAAGSANRATSFFTSEYARQQTGTAGMAPFSLFRTPSEKLAAARSRGDARAHLFFHALCPVRVEVLPQLAKIVFYSDGSHTMHPLPTAAAPIYNATAADEEVPESATFVAFREFYESLPEPVIVAYQRVHAEVWIVIVFHRHSSHIMCFGSNSEGHFGRGGGARPLTFSSLDGSFRFLDGSNETIQQVAIGETHSLILATSGTVYIAGIANKNNTVDCSNTGVNETQPTLYNTFTPLAYATNVTHIAAGYNFSVLVWFNTTNPNITRQSVTVCGGAGFLNPSAVGNATDLARTGGVWRSDVLYRELFSGAFHFCTWHAEPGDALTKRIICVGTGDSVGGAPSSNPVLNNVICSTSPRTTYTTSRVEALSVGRHHVALSMAYLSLDPTALTYQRFRMAATCGSNSFGQLGANLRNGGPVPGNVWPTFPFSEKIFASRPPALSLRANDEQLAEQTALVNNYHLFETVAVQALFNTTYIFTRAKVFNTPLRFMRNYSLAAKHLPPDGVYDVRRIFADLFTNTSVWSTFDVVDAVPWRPPTGGTTAEPTTAEPPTTTQQPANATAALTPAPTDAPSAAPKRPPSPLDDPTLEAKLWFTTFSAMKGKALFLVANQTSLAGRFTDNPFATNTRDPTYVNESDFADSYSADGTFIRDWSILRGRNVSYSTFANTTQSTVVTTTLVSFIPLVFFVTSSGDVFPKSKLTTEFSPEAFGKSCVIADNHTKTVIYACGASGTPAETEILMPGFNVGLSRKWSWVAMLVSIEAYNITSVRVFPGNNVTTAPRIDPASDWSKYYGAAHYDQLLTLHGCQPTASASDCSSAVFTESFHPTQPSPSQLLAVATDGMQSVQSAADGEAVFANPLFQTLTPNIGFLHLQTFRFGAGTIGLGQLSARGLTETACIFVRLGRFHYFLQLMRDSSVVLCNYQGMVRATRTATLVQPPATPSSTAAPLTAPPIPSPAPEPNIVPTGLRGFRTWQATGPNRLTLYTIDLRNNLMPQVVYVNGTAISNFVDPRNLTLQMGPMGGVATTIHGLDYSGYCLLTNSTVQALLTEDAYYDNLSPLSQLLQYPNGAPLEDSSNFFISPQGTFASHYMPVVPIVPVFNVVALSFRAGSGSVLAEGDALVIRLVNSNNEQIAQHVQLALSFGGGLSPETVNDNTRLRFATKPFYTPVCTARGQKLLPWETRELESKISDAPNTFFCIRRPIPFNQWSELLIEVDQAGVTRLYVNGGIVGGGRLLLPQHLEQLRGIEFVLRNLRNASLATFQVQQVVVCRDYTIGGANGAPNVYPCSANGKAVSTRRRGASGTVTDSASFTKSFQATASQRLTDTKTLRLSESSTPSVSADPSVSVSDSDEASLSFSPTVSPLNFSVTDSFVITKTKTFSDRLDKNLSLMEVSRSSNLMSAQNIRKEGQSVTLYLRQDVFNPIVLWSTHAAAYFQCTSSRSVRDNPVGFCPAFHSEGFATGTFLPTKNNSYLVLSFGPSTQYNSWLDENVTLTMISLGAASTFPIPGSIHLFIKGRGATVSTSSRVAEGAAALVAVAGVLVGGPSSILIKIAINSISLNFHCYNSERGYPLSFLNSPTEQEVAGSSKLGAGFFNIAIIFGLVTLHLCMVVVIRRKKNCNIVKAQADVAFPSLSFVISTMLVPGFLQSAWQGAVESRNLGMFTFVVVTTVLVVIIPFVALMRRLHGEGNLKATFQPFTPDLMEKLNHATPLLSIVIPRGTWISTDRHRVFHKRFHFFLTEYREGYGHWYCVEYAEAIAFGGISCFGNNVSIICATQLAAMVGTKLAVIALTLYCKPCCTHIGNFPTLVVHTVQFAGLGVLFIDTINGGTRAYSATAAALFTLATFLLLGMSIIMTGVVSYIRYLRAENTKEMQQLAYLFRKHGALLSQRDQGAEEAEAAIEMVEPAVNDGALEATRGRSPLESAAADDTASRSTRGHSAPQSPVRSPRVRRAVSHASDDGASAMNVSFVGASFAMIPVGVSSSAAASPPRDFWRIAAMEELGAPPVGDIPHDQEVDDML